MTNQAETVVWKLGSASCVNEDGIRHDRLWHYADEIADQVLNLDNRAIIVISGAVATANTMILTEQEREDEAINDQMRATLGNVKYFKAWIDSLERVGLRAGEFLVTHHELNLKHEGKSFAHTIGEYMAAGWVSLVNESGAVDDTETRKLVYGGDNDGLAEVVAEKTDADRVCFLTEEIGLLDKQRQLIPIVDEKNAAKALRISRTARTKSNGGTGGIHSKVLASRKSARKGRPAHIAHAKSHFERVRQHQTGTYFVPRRRQTIVK